MQKETLESRSNEMSWQETTEIWDSEMLLVPGVPMQQTFLYSLE